MSGDDFTEERIQAMVGGVSGYLRGERTIYIRHSEPLALSFKTAMQGYFSPELLGGLKTITLKGARIPPPPFYVEAKKMSGGRFPDFVHMASITYIDVIVFHDKIETRTLFHGLVHAAQMAVLGFEKYVDWYVRGFVKNRSWMAIPLEDQAYKLEARYVENPEEKFSVEEEIGMWLRDGRYS